MKSGFFKNVVKPIAVLLLVCIVSVAVLAALNLLTKPIVEEQEREAIAESLRVVLPEGEFGDPETLTDSMPKTVTAIYRDVNGRGAVVTVVTRGYVGEIAVTVGVDSEGKVVKAVVTNQSESHGKAGMDSYTDRFAGLDAEGVKDAELFSGATISSTAIRGAVSDALAALGYGAEGGEDPEAGMMSDADIIETIKEAKEGAVYERIEASGVEPTVKKVFRSTVSDDYAVYTITSTQYVAKETEAIIYIDSDGQITGINLIGWTVGHGVNYTQDYLNGFVGKDSTTIDGIDLVAEATGTSEHLRDAAKDAIAAVSADPILSDKAIEAKAKEMLGNASLEKINPENKPATVKKLFRETVGGGYIAYVVTSTQYVAKETEGIIAIDSTGKITDVSLLCWTVGHGVDYTEAYLDSFIGKNAESLTEVELVTEATGTSVNFRNAVGDALSLITPDYGFVWQIASGVVVALAVIGFVTFCVLRRRYR